MELISGVNDLSQPRVNVVFIGLDYADAAELVEWSSGLVNYDGSYGDHGLLQVEPFDTRASKFNFWYVDEIFEFEGTSSTFGDWIGPGSEDVATQYCPDVTSNRQVIVLYRDSDAGSGPFWAVSARPGVVCLMDQSEYIDISFHRQSAQKALLHEFGHSFGLLVDEYRMNAQSVVALGSRINCDTASETVGCPKWCSGAPVPVEDIAAIDCSYGTDRLTCINEYNRVEDKPCIWITDSEAANLGASGCVNVAELCTSKTTESSCSNTVTADTDGFQACWWSDDEDPYFKSNCIPYWINNINIGTGCDAGTGCYHTCHFVNLYRSSINSMMGGAENFYSSRTVPGIEDMRDNYNQVQKNILIDGLDALV